MYIHTISYYIILYYAILCIAMLYHSITMKLDNNVDAYWFISIYIGRIIESY